MTDYPLALSDIVSWFRAKQALLKDAAISLGEIRERTENLPAASADFTGRNAMGRINGWVSGEFDFEVVRISDGGDLLWRRIPVSSLSELDATYVDFIRSLEAGGEAELPA